MFNKQMIQEIFNKLSYYGELEFTEPFQLENSRRKACKVETYEFEDGNNDISGVTVHLDNLDSVDIRDLDSEDIAYIYEKIVMN